MADSGFADGLAVKCEEKRRLRSQWKKRQERNILEKLLEVKTENGP